MLKEVLQSRAFDWQRRRCPVKLGGGGLDALEEELFTWALAVGGPACGAEARREHEPGALGVESASSLEQRCPVGASAVADVFLSAS